MTDERIKRINELYKKSQAEGLTPREKEEQTRLRQEYIKSFRRSMVSQMNNITIKEKDGRLTRLKDKGIKE